VPRVSAFYGVVIYMYWNERDHPVVHFHAYHAGRRASVSVDGNVLAGSLEPRALQFVREWASLRHDEIVGPRRLALHLVRVAPRQAVASVPADRAAMGGGANNAAR
jgi:hypothetical protein